MGRKMGLKEDGVWKKRGLSGKGSEIELFWNGWKGLEQVNVWYEAKSVWRGVLE